MSPAKRTARDRLRGFAHGLAGVSAFMFILSAIAIAGAPGNGKAVFIAGLIGVASLYAFALTGDD